MAGNII